MLFAMPATDTIAHGAEFLARGDLAGAEAIAAAKAPDPDALHLMALVRVRQERLDEALALLQRSLALRPGNPQAQMNMGKLFLLMGRNLEAAQSLESALTADPGLNDAWLELGDARQRLGDAAGAEQSYRRHLALKPDDLFARMALAVAVKDQGRAAEAEGLLATGLAAAREPLLKSGFAYNLGLAQYDQGKREAALESFSIVAALEPERATVAITRAELMQELSRQDEAEKILKDLVARDPANEAAHLALNELIFRLGRGEEFLASFDRAPQTTGLQLSKANLLFKTGQPQAAEKLFAEILAREPENRDAALGASFALNQLGRHGEAMMLLEKAVASHPGDVGLHNNLAATALQARDAQKAVFHAEKSLMLKPVNALGLATLGSAWRMMGDDRDEMLNGYDELAQIFDLDAPAGFSGMAAFNEELNAWLARRHDTIREPIEQSLRGGSQTSGHIFNEGHALIEALKSRIHEAMAAYIAGIRPDAGHPFRCRKSADFRYTGSWSSRLRDCGYHVNHIHPAGWISSCYYVGVPEAVKDETAKQGWIKFGEPGFETGMGFRRAIQPRPGRLVLFPSYMWHGTIPFHDASPRTTIAFDAVPGQGFGGA